MRNLSSKSMLLIYALVVLASPRPLFGDDASKRAKLSELMTLQGREGIAEQQLQVYKKQTRELASQALEQYRKDLKLVDNDPYYTRMGNAYQHFVEVSVPPWTAAEATNLYADLMAQYLSEADADQSRLRPDGDGQPLLAAGRGHRERRNHRQLRRLQDLRGARRH